MAEEKDVSTIIAEVHSRVNSLRNTDPFSLNLNELEAGIQKCDRDISILLNEARLCAIGEKDFREQVAKKRNTKGKLEYSAWLIRKSPRLEPKGSA